MANLRATGLTVKNSITIEVTFTASLDLSIGSSNITISGAGSNAIALMVRSIDISNKILTIVTQPMIPGGQYELVIGRAHV